MQKYEKNRITGSKWSIEKAISTPLLRRINIL